MLVLKVAPRGPNRTVRAMSENVWVLSAGAGRLLEVLTFPLPTSFCKNFRPFPSPLTILERTNLPLSEYCQQPFPQSGFVHLLQIASPFIFQTPVTR